MGKILAILVLAFLATASAQAVDVTLVTKAMHTEWWRTVREGAEKFASEQEDMRLGIYYPEREIDVDRQIEIIRERIASRPDSLVLALCGIQEMVPVLDEIGRAEIPFVIFDGDIDIDTPFKKAYVGSENYDGGALAGRFAAAALPEGGDVAVITGVMGHGSHISRVAGFADQIRKNPAIRIVSQQQANSERQLSRRMTRNILDYNPRLALLFATNDEMALGAADAVREAGSRTRIVGFDGIGEARDAVRTGALLATVDTNPFRLGYEAARAGYMAAQGEELPEYIPITYTMITADTVESASPLSGKK